MKGPTVHKGGHILQVENLWSRDTIPNNFNSFKRIEICLMHRIYYTWVTILGTPEGLCILWVSRLFLNVCQWSLVGWFHSSSIFRLILSCSSVIEGRALKPPAVPVDLHPSAFHFPSCIWKLLLGVYSQLAVPL